MHLTGSIFWYPWEGGGNNCNSIFIKGEKNILVDPGHVKNEFGEPCLDSLKSKLKEDGFTFNDIDLVLLTHGHPDHCEAAGVVCEEAGARLAIHNKEEEVIEAVARMFGRNSAGGEDKPFVEPDILLQEGKLEAGQDREIEVVHTPGHSPGSASYFLSDEGVLISGDAVFRGSIGRTDLPGGNMKEMAQTVDKLSRMEGIKWLLPGHMGPVEGEENVSRNFSMIKSVFF